MPQSTKPQIPSPHPMTRRGPDGRPYITAETEQRATEAQKSREDEVPFVPSVPLNGPPD